ncbi:conserved hypothetical protein [Rubrivivax sp. A210]|uniref:TRAFs-binding domain-containing protein n=1 Tax=Rubrivivax sp. A210 TaxID=2772301 RepID=UPI00191A2415|nr:TRAFs-binding domain-containing protein [Rubrivivax sp. A210]CAD5373485.1 conserved hypothetical protein [Rubrivivax sp. A210]
MPTCFVVQGFGKKIDYSDGRVLDLDASYSVIKEAVEAAGLECIRADEIRHSGTIDVPMYEQLLRADLVIADLSTSNVNAAFELGVRYGLRPRATIVVAETGFKNPFDVSHIVITPYKHLGEDIGRAEARRFKDALVAHIQGILAQDRVDSPVYTFLQRLAPPNESALKEAMAAAATAPPGLEASADDAQSQKRMLDKAMAKMNPPPGQKSDFMGAKSLLQMLHDDRPCDCFIVQQMALATYKSRLPTPKDALLEAKTMLETIAPATTNDPETLGLWGAVHKRLWELEGRDEDLSTSINAYSRGFYLKQDFYNGINFAVLLELRGLLSAKAGEREEAIADKVLARRVREEVLGYLEPMLEDAAELPPDKRYWVLASKWEICVALGRDAAAAEQAARALQPADWMIESTESQLSRVRQTQAELQQALAAPAAPAP